MNNRRSRGLERQYGPRNARLLQEVKSCMSQTRYGRLGVSCPK